MFEHCYISSAVSLNPWCALAEIKYKKEQEKNYFAYFLDLDSCGRRKTITPEIMQSLHHFGAQARSGSLNQYKPNPVILYY